MDTPQTRPPASALQRSLFDSVKVVLPTLLAVMLFGGAVFGYFLPVYEQALMDRKRDSLRELTDLATHVLKKFHAREQSGELTRAAAQHGASDVLRGLRYGAEDNEYFWINDTDYRLIMHPYRPDMEGKSMVDFSDPTGKKMFVEFVDVATTRGEGFVDYMWQWHGDASRIEPKLSHVRSFSPWHWVVGTGMYVDDVRKEIATVTRRTYFAAALAVALLTAIAIYIVHSGIVVANARRRAEEELLRHQDNLEHTVAERTAELRNTNAALAHENAERRLLEDQLRQLSCSDELTGLLNRRGFFTAAEFRLAEAERSGQSLFLVYADLDDFKGINDRLGHAMGDHALQTFSDVLHEDFRSGDIGARLGGDEFAMLLTGGAGYSSEQQIAERVQHCIEARNHDALGYRLEASVGVARYVPGTGQSLEGLLVLADTAMYACKQEHRNKSRPGA